MSLTHSIPARLTFAFAAMMVASSPLAAGDGPIRINITRDTYVSSVADERGCNLGGSSYLKTKGIDEFTLFDIDPAPLKGHVITSANLHLKPTSSDVQKRLSVSTLAAEWGEGTSSRYRAQPGGASFLSPFGDQNKPWAYPGSDITAVINSVGNTIYHSAPATAVDAQGWQSVAVDPRVITARVAGISGGFVIFDDIGSEYSHEDGNFKYRLFPNRFFSSHESGNVKAPYLTIELGDPDTEPPEPVAFQPAPVVSPTDVKPGEAIVSWMTPHDHGPAGTLGFFVRCSQTPAADWGHMTPLPRYLIPMAGEPGETVSLRLRDMSYPPDTDVFIAVRPIDAAGNLGPPATTRVRTAAPPPPVQLPAAPALFTDIAANPKIGDAEVFIIDAFDKVQPVTGEIIPAHSAAYTQANHLWSAAKKTIRLYAARNESTAFQIVLTGSVSDAHFSLTFNPEGDTTPRARLLRFRHVASKRGPLPDPLVALTTLDLPANDEKIDGQKSATVLAEVYVPHDEPSGIHCGKLAITSGGKALELTVELHTWNFELPDKLSFIPEMNCYDLPDPPLATAYYRLAQENRTCLNCLPYGWTGRVHAGCAPTWKNGRFEWAEWDHRFGPLLDGSAFKSSSRGAVPVETFYLPLNENWPMSIDRGFTGGYWSNDSLTAPYRAELVEASRQIAEHMTQHGWTNTVFEFFLNGKVYYKQQGWDRCSSPWIFDEPVNAQDFAALRWYGLAFHEGVAEALQALRDRARPRLAFRCDISRPQWQRDLLDRVVDVDVVAADTFAAYHRMVMDRATTHRQLTMTYGDSDVIEDANTQPALWCIDSWCGGADGVLPWQTVGNGRSWERADSQSLFYPPLHDSDSRPIPSIRLKSYCRGEQDVEYFTLLCRNKGLERWAVAELVRRELGLSSHTQKSGEDAAAVVGFTDPDAVVKLWRLRTRIGAALNQ